MSAHKTDMEQQKERKTFDAALRRLGTRVKLLQSRTEALRIHQAAIDQTGEAQENAERHVEPG